MMLRIVILLICLPNLAWAESAADRFHPQRGVNLDIWVDWKSIDDILSEPGFLDIYPDWPRHMPKGRLEQLKTDGFDHIRLPIDPSPLISLGPGPLQDRLISQIRLRADEVQAAGLKVIVDLHTWPRFDENETDVDTILSDAAQFDQYLALLTKVGAALNDLSPEKTAFELMNEPTNDCAALYEGAEQDWPGMLQRMHKAARAGAPDLPLVLSGACWGGVDGLVLLDPKIVNDDNVIWSFHSYEPFTFTHQSAGWTEGAQRWFSELPYPGASIDRAKALELVAIAAAKAADPDEAVKIANEMELYLNSDQAATVAPLRKVAEWADRNGIPHGRLYMGEFGAIAGNDQSGGSWSAEPRAAFLKDKRTGAEELGIGWAVWLFSLLPGSFTIADDSENRQIDPAVCDALGLSGC